MGEAERGGMVRREHTSELPTAQRLHALACDALDGPVVVAGSHVDVVH